MPDHSPSLEAVSTSLGVRQPALLGCPLRDLVTPSMIMLIVSASWLKLAPYALNSSLWMGSAPAAHNAKVSIFLPIAVEAMRRKALWTYLRNICIAFVTAA